MPPLLRPSAPTAPDALLCGDPARALAIAQHLMELPRMSNHNRGLWGYHGLTRQGDELTVQGTGIGAPSAVAVLEELVASGARRVIRIGTCTASGERPLGSRWVITSASSSNGSSRALGVDGAVRPDPTLTAALLELGGEGAHVLSSDLRRVDPPQGAVADMQTAGVLASAARLGIAAAALVVVTRVGDRPLGDEPGEAAALAAAEIARDVLGARTAPRPTSETADPGSASTST